jgi:hypothetical protein
LADAIREGASTVEMKHLATRALSVAQCRNILKKIKEGETYQAQIEAEVEQLRAELGLPLKPTFEVHEEGHTFTEGQLGATQGRLRRKNVGNPKPKRHRVGTN